MSVLDVFNADAFSLRELTAAILKAPYKPSRIGELNLFEERAVTSTIVMIEEKDGQLTLIPRSPRGAPGDSIGAVARVGRPLSVPHLLRRSTVLADEVQNVRAFGSDNALEGVQDVVNDRLATLRAMHEVTLEYHRLGAIKGLILDADGLTTIYDLFAEFGVVQQTHDFAFSVATTDIRAQCVAVARKVEDALGAARYTGIRAFCSDEWFDAMIGHTNVIDSFKYQEGQVLRSDLRRGFTFGGITFEEYPGSVGGVSFIEDDVAYAFPEGVRTERGSLFTTYFAPADYADTVNTPGLPIYARQERMDFDRGIMVESQSNPLALCLRPRALVKLTKS